MNNLREASTGSFFGDGLAASDPEVAAAINDELRRQQEEIELIASENIVSKAVLEAAGSVLTNKYAEGYPGRRYYGGCQYVDVAEKLAIDRAKKLFDCSYVNVQPNSGSQANQGAMMAMIIVWGGIGTSLIPYVPGADGFIALAQEAINSLK